MDFKDPNNRKEYEHDKERYRIVRDTAWKTLLDCNIDRLPVDLKAITKHYGIRIYTDEKIGYLNPDEIGISLKLRGEWLIIFDNTMSDTRIRFTLAHEIGHILLGHPPECSRTDRYVKNRSKLEDEADKFAAKILAPACILHALNLTTPEEIMVYCMISHSAAQIRANRMTVLRERDKFLSSALEVQVLRQFFPYVEKHMRNK